MPEYWERFESGPEYVSEDFESEGFIHCSFESQLDAVLKRYYAHKDRVLLLQVEPDLLEPELRIEPSTNSELYPHIYGPINRNAIVAVEERFLESPNQHSAS